MGERSHRNRRTRASGLTSQEAQEEGGKLYVYDRIPLSTVAYTIKGLKEWQTQCERAEKGAICRTFSPNVNREFDIRLPITPGVRAIVSGNGKTRSYLKTFNLKEEFKCPCNEGQQTVEHIIHFLCPNCCKMRDCNTLLLLYMGFDCGKGATSSTPLNHY
jgi:hypothetical protein